MEITTVEVAQHHRCPQCAEESVARRVYAVNKGELPPDLTPLRNTARRHLSANETVEIAAAGGGGEGGQGCAAA